MNLIKKGIFTLLVAGLIVSCEEDDMVKPVENATGTGLTEITFSSFKATPGPDAEGLEDGTYITVKPLAIGVSYKLNDHIFFSLRYNKGLTDINKNESITVKNQNNVFQIAAGYAF